MMQPLSLSTKPTLPTGLAGTAGTTNAATALSGSPLNTSPVLGSGQGSLATVLPMLLQVTQLLIGMLGGQGAGASKASTGIGNAGTAGTAGTAGNAGTAAASGNVGNAGTAAAGGYGATGNVGNAGTAAAGGYGATGKVGNAGTAAVGGYGATGNVGNAGTAAAGGYGATGNVGNAGTAAAGGYGAGGAVGNAGTAATGGYGATGNAGTAATGEQQGGEKAHGKHGKHGKGGAKGAGGHKGGNKANAQGNVGNAGTNNAATGQGTGALGTGALGTGAATGTGTGTVSNASTSTAGVPINGTNAAGVPISDIRNIDYTQLSEQQRQDFNGVSRDSAAILHLGGRANISGAVTANGVSPSAQIYNNVLQNPGNFKPEEQALVQQFSQDEIARRGMITGEDLDHAFIDEMGSRNGVDAQTLQQYHANVDQRVNNMLANPNRDGVIADSQQQLNLVDDVGTLQQQSGLNKTEQATFRLAGHATLFSGDGSVNGDILAITMGNPNALDNHGAGNNGSIDDETQALLNADVADDGQINGSSLRSADSAVLGKLYGGGAGVANNDAIVNQGVQTGMTNGRSMQDIQNSIMNGGQQALNDFKSMAKDHSPAMLAMGATMAGAAAVCPFLGGMAAGAAGIGAAQKAGAQQQ